MTRISPHPDSLLQSALFLQSALPRLAGLALLCGLVAGCSGFATGFVSDLRTTRSAGVAVDVPARAPAPSAAPAAIGAVLTESGDCTGPVATGPTEITPGIGECDLVRIKGRKPTDVLVGQGSLGERETQVMYAEPGGRELYFFSANKLVRVFRPGA